MSESNNKYHKSNKWHCDKCNLDFHPTYKYTHLKTKKHLEGFEVMTKEESHKKAMAKYYNNNKEKLVKYQREFYYNDHEKKKEMNKLNKRQQYLRKHEKDYRETKNSLENEDNTFLIINYKKELSQIKNKIINYSNKWNISSELSELLKAEQ